ncbi:MAG TPA: transcriptional regulator [Acidobacteriaceae bacterium]|nr:transcriptional regulator [Acidobacteriaceae bacterium]
MKRLHCIGLLLAALTTGLFAPAARADAAPWPSIGPDGGDARRFAFDPRDPGRIYLGTTDSWIYVSTDGGSSWARLARLPGRENLVIDSLVVDRSDPRTLYAGVYVADQTGGGIFVSHDRGQAWSEAPGMRGQPVFALAQAPSRPAVLVAGTLNGVYETVDQGQHWRAISPPGSKEVHEVQSVAIDPFDPQTIYAGTWHLPWKTTDGGANWKSISTGLIDDSDVFSIIVDRSRPSVLFASACSGIYRTDDYAGTFRKIQGIPSTARRTRVLMMDPADRNTVYAGTTEGLYKTVDGGDNWTRTTGPDVIVNDVYVDPRNPKHILLATDRSGVLASEDAGAGFIASNTGFSQRQVAALLPDVKTPGTLYAGVVNDKIYGGVFITTDFGRTWKQQSDGLAGRDVFELAQGADGTLLAGTSDGVYRWADGAWTEDDTVTGRLPMPAPPKPKKTSIVRGKRITHREPIRREPKLPVVKAIHGRVTALVADGATWYAATALGMFRSADDGATWEGPILGEPLPGVSAATSPYTAIAVAGDTAFAASRQGIMTSSNQGVIWQPIVYPSGLTAVNALAVTPDGAIWAGGREGLFISSNHGATWNPLKQLPVVDISSLAWDDALHRVILTSWQSTVIFAIDPGDKTWKWWNTGWTVRSVASVGDRLVAASQFSGVVVQPPPETSHAGGAAQTAQR